jgi:hypothetical protein
MKGVEVKTKKGHSGQHCAKTMPNKNAEQRLRELSH